MSTTGVKKGWVSEYYAEPMTTFAALAFYFNVRIDQSLEQMDSYYEAWQLYCLENQPVSLSQRHYSDFVLAFCHLDRDCKLAITKQVQHAFKSKDSNTYLDRLLLLHQILTNTDLVTYGKSLSTYVPNAPQNYIPGFSALRLIGFPSQNNTNTVTSSFDSLQITKR